MRRTSWGWIDMPGPDAGRLRGPAGSGRSTNLDPQARPSRGYSSINTDGSISGFLGATGTHTISKTTGGYNFYNHSTAYFADATGNAHVLVIGGEDTNTGAPLAQAWYQH
jgi:hypothetical protein